MRMIARSPVGGLGACLVVLLVAAGCGGGSGQAARTTTRPQPPRSTTSSTTSTTTTTTTTAAAPSSTVPNTGPATSVVPTTAVVNALIAAYATYAQAPAADLMADAPVDEAYVPSTGTYWAFDTFDPTAAAVTTAQSWFVRLQDGNNIAVLSNLGQGWQVVGTQGAGEFSRCTRDEAFAPVSVLTVWGICPGT